ncbi:MAG: PQQ-binding-like beta-propeller repeat protein [Caldisericaceae bacterium]
MKNKLLIAAVVLLTIVALLAVYFEFLVPLPELSMGDVKFAPKQPNINFDAERFSAKIQNTGKAKAGSFDVCLFDGDKLVNSKTIDGLDKGESVNISFDYKLATAGHLEMKLVVDCKGKIRERNKSNNKITFELDISETPSLVTNTVFKKQLGSTWFPTNYGGSAPVVYNERIYVGGKNQYFFCLNKDTGEEIWKYEIKNAGFMPGVFTTPVFYNGNVYFGSTGSSLTQEGGHILALSADNGSTVWEFDTPSDVYSIALDKGEIYALMQDGSIFVLNALSGSPTRRYNIPERASFVSSVVINDGKICATSSSSLFCIDTATGNIIWSFKTDDNLVSKPIVYVERVFLDGIYCLNAKSGSVMWEEKEIKQGAQLMDGDLFVATVDGNLYCLDALTGQKIVERPFEPVVAEPFLYDNKLYIGTTTGKIYVVDNGLDTIEVFQTGEAITTRPLVYDGKIYVVSDDGYLYCFSDK